MGSNLGLLPADVLLKIFSYCSYHDRVNFQFVCRWWKQVSRDKSLWRDIVYKPGWNESIQEIINNLKASPELRALDLRHVIDLLISKQLVETIVNRCYRLEQLSVSWNSLYKKFRVKMKKIKILVIEGYMCIDFDYLHYCFPNVEHLDFNSDIIRVPDLEEYLWKKNSSLYSIGFACETRLQSGCTLKHLLKCTNLKSLTLHHPCRRAGRLPGQSVQNLKQILSLTLIGAWLQYAEPFLPMFMYFPNLVVLQLHRCSLYSEERLLVVAENCPLLEKLTLCSTRLLWDQGLKYISNFKKLQFLCLRSNYYITDACVAHLQAILDLRYLDISNCRLITPKCLLPLCSFDKLQSLKFDLRHQDLPADLSTTHVKNQDLHIMFYRCKDVSVLDRLRCQRFRVSLLKSVTSGVKCCCVF